MRINNESCFEILKKYLSSYRHIFHKRSLKIFLLIIISIIVMQKMQSIKFIYEKFISKFWNKSLNSIYFFLKSDKYSLEEKGHQDRKMLLNMAGLYTDKQEMNISGQIDIGAKADLIEKYLNDD